VKYSNVAFFNAIDNDIGPGGNTAQALAEVVSSAAEVRML
jgi:hypothetical protein